MGRHSRQLLLACCLLCGTAGAAAQSGLEFSFASVTDFDRTAGGKVLQMKGEIAPGDLLRLQHYLAGNGELFVQHGGRVVFSVAGGDVEESMLIGEFLRDAMIEAWLPDAGRALCESACFFMYAGAATRSAAAGTVGVHRPSFDAADLAAARADAARRRYDGIFAKAVAYLDALLVPRDLIETLLATPPHQTHWLSRGDLDRLGHAQPWFEDLAAARCGAGPDLRRRLESALAADYTMEAQAYKEELEAATPCMEELRRRQRRQIVDGLANLPE